MARDRVPVSITQISHDPMRPPAVNRSSAKKRETADHPEDERLRNYLDRVLDTLERQTGTLVQGKQRVRVETFLRKELQAEAEVLQNIRTLPLAPEDAAYEAQEAFNQLRAHTWTTILDYLAEQNQA